MKRVFLFCALAAVAFAQYNPPGGSAGTGTVTSVATTGPITGGTITGTGTIACATCGVTGTGLGQFASTTSAQLGTVLSDESGTGVVCFTINCAMTTPNLGTPSAINLSNATALPASALPTLTYTPSVFGGANLIPDSSGNVFAEPFTVLSASAFFAYQVMAFADTATLDCMYSRWNVPINYQATTTTFIIDWNTTATSGNAIWTLDYRDVSTATLAATTSQEALTVTTAASGTASARVQSTVTATAANFSAGDIVQIRVCRNGAGADTIAATLAIHDIRFSYVGRP